jgi:hypothetical protein
LDEQQHIRNRGAGEGDREPGGWAGEEMQARMLAERERARAQVIPYVHAGSSFAQTCQIDLTV